PEISNPNSHSARPSPDTGFARPVVPSLRLRGPAAPYTTLARRRKPDRSGRDCAPSPAAPQRRQGHSSASLVYGAIIEIVITGGDCKKGLRDRGASRPHPTKRAGETPAVQYFLL